MVGVGWVGVVLEVWKILNLVNQSRQEVARFSVDRKPEGAVAL